MAHPKPGPRRLVHLTEDHDRVRQYASLAHLAVKLLGLATALADAAKQADTFVPFDYVVDQLVDQHRLADARTAEQARLATEFQRRQEIDHFHARDKDLLTSHPLVQR